MGLGIAVRIGHLRQKLGTVKLLQKAIVLGTINAGSIPVMPTNRKKGMKLNGYITTYDLTKFYTTECKTHKWVVHSGVVQLARISGCLPEGLRVRVPSSLLKRKR